MRKRKDSLASLRREISSRDEYIDRLNRQIIQGQDELNERDGRLTGKQKEIDALKKRVEALKGECANLTADLHRALGYIDAINEEKRKPIERVMQEPPPPSGPCLMQNQTEHLRPMIYTGREEIECKRWWRT